MAVGAKQQAALQLMKEKGIRESDYHPLGLKILWGLGVDCPPPMMATFFKNALVCGGFFGAAMGLFFYVGLSSQSFGRALVGGIVCGTFFGLAMATYFRSVRRKHNIPMWRDFNPAN
jgi:hypothetical protein